MPRKTKIGTEVAHVGHQFQGQKVKSQLVADVLNSQHVGIGATWRINTKILSTCRGRRHIVAAARLQLLIVVMALRRTVFSYQQQVCVGLLLCVYTSTVCTGR